MHCRIMFSVFINVDLEIRVTRGYQNWYHSMACWWLPYKHLTLTILEIFAFQKYSDLETRVRGHLQSLHIDVL